MVVNRSMMIAGGVALAGVAFFYLYGKKEGGGGFFQDVGTGIGGAAVDVVDGVVSGITLGIGDKIGIPRTNKTACEKALEEGRKWDASFACPAGTFIKSFF